MRHKYEDKLRSCVSHEDETACYKQSLRYFKVLVCLKICKIPQLSGKLFTEIILISCTIYVIDKMLKKPYIHLVANMATNIAAMTY